MFVKCLIHICILLNVRHSSTIFKSRLLEASKLLRVGLFDMIKGRAEKKIDVSSLHF